MIIGLSIVLFSQNVWADNKSTELALFEEIPMVITPGKKLQPITEAPASVYVITGDDIRQNPSIHLWDLLREVPGMDVVTSTIGQADVSMRGFDDLATNKTLLLIDGRSMYIPMQGLMIWEMIPVQLEEIERIEIVKGPVAALYGANANLGLINIITKNAKDINGGRLTMTGGERDTKRFAITYGGTAPQIEQLSYKVSTGWKDTNSFNNERGRDALDGVQGNMQFDYELGDNAKASFSTGISQNDSYLYLTSDVISQEFYYGPVSQTMSYMKGDYQAGNFSARIFWNEYQTDLRTKKLSIQGISDTYDLELKYNFEISEDHSVIVGGGGRYDHVDANLFSDTDDNIHTQGSANVFIQDDFKLTDQLRINTSARIDQNKITGANPSARLAFIYQPVKTDVYRLSGGYSFRNPTLSDLYLNLPIDVTGTGVISTAMGNKGLHPERYVTYELSWQGQRLDNRLRLFADTFWTQITDFIEPYRTGGGLFTLDSSFRNLGKADSSGGELGGEYDFTKWLTLKADYALNLIKYNDVQEEHFSPKHKANLGLKFKFLEERLSAKLTAHYVSGAEMSLGDDGKVPSYILGGLWMGYKFNPNMEVSVMGNNVFYDKHQEIFGADDVGTRYLGKLDVKF